MLLKFLGSPQGAMLSPRCPRVPTANNNISSFMFQVAIDEISKIAALYLPGAVNIGKPNGGQPLQMQLVSLQCS